MVNVIIVPVRIFIVCVVFFGFSLDAVAQNKVVVIPLTDDGITCKGTLVGTRWCDNGDATVTDMTTGLVWLQFADWGGAKPWRSDDHGDHDDADTRAATLQDGVLVHTGAYNVYLSDGSYDGIWRLPTKTELSQLANGPEAVRGTNIRAFSGVKSESYECYWSSSTLGVDPYDQYAWTVNFGDGNPYTKLKGSDTYNYVWPVRGGN